MRVIYLLPFLYLVACGSNPNNHSRDNPPTDLKNPNSATKTNIEKLSDSPELKWSEFLGHYFLHLPDDTPNNEIPEASQMYYDFRYSDSSLVVMKCQDFENCGDKFILVFHNISEDSIIFRPLNTNRKQPLTFSFHQNSVFVTERNNTTLKLELTRYDSDRPNNRKD